MSAGVHAANIGVIVRKLRAHPTIFQAQLNGVFEHPRTNSRSTMALLHGPGTNYGFIGARDTSATFLRTV